MSLRDWPRRQIWRNLKGQSNLRRFGPAPQHLLRPPGLLAGKWRVPGVVSRPDATYVAAMAKKTNGQRVRELREERLWTQEQLSEVSGVSLRSIQRVEKGEAVSMETLKNLAATLDVDADELVPPRNSLPENRNTPFGSSPASRRESTSVSWPIARATSSTTRSHPRIRRWGPSPPSYQTFKTGA